MGSKATFFSLPHALYKGMHQTNLNSELLQKWACDEYYVLQPMVLSVRGCQAFHTSEETAAHTGTR